MPPKPIDPAADNVSDTQRTTYRWLMQQSRNHSGWFMSNIGCGIIAAIMTITQALILAQLLQWLIIEQQPIHQHTGYWVGLLASMLLRSAMLALREYTGFIYASRLRQTIRHRLLETLQNQGPSLVEKHPQGHWLSVLMEHVESLHDFFARYLPQMILAVLIPVGFLIVILPISWLAFILLLVTAPLIPLFMILVGRRAAAVSQENFQALSRLSAYFLDRLRGLATLTLYNRAAAETRALEHSADQWRIKTMQVLKMAFLSSFVLEFFAAISIALIAVYLGMSYLHYLNFGHYGPNLSLFAGLFILLLTPEFYQPLRDLGSYYHARAQAIAAAQSLIDILSLPNKTMTHQSSCTNQPMRPVSIHCNGLSVVNDTEDMRLTNITCTLPQAGTTMIIGASGSGKTTLLNTLMGFQAHQGHVHFYAQQQRIIWPNMAWVGQNPQLFYDSLRNNLHMQRPISDADLIQALKRAHAWEFVQQLPQGLNTLIGEQGAGLSVGQKQRLVLARALAQPCQLLLLDEPTAALDIHSAQAIDATLNHLDPPCTCVMVTHRLDQLQRADHILVLDQGKLVQQGTFAQLEASTANSAYQQLRNTWQAALYY